MKQGEEIEDQPQCKKKNQKEEPDAPLSLTLAGVKISSTSSTVMLFFQNFLLQFQNFQEFIFISAHVMGTRALIHISVRFAQY